MLVEKLVRAHLGNRFNHLADLPYRVAEPAVAAGRRHLQSFGFPRLFRESRGGERDLPVRVVLGGVQRGQAHAGSPERHLAQPLVDHARTDARALLVAAAGADRHADRQARALARVFVEGADLPAGADQVGQLIPADAEALQKHVAELHLLHVEQAEIGRVRPVLEPAVFRAELMQKIFLRGQDFCRALVGLRLVVLNPFHLSAAPGRSDGQAGDLRVLVAEPAHPLRFFLAAGILPGNAQPVAHHPAGLIDIHM